MMFLDQYEHPDLSIMYTPRNIPGLGCDPVLFENCPAISCTCSDKCLDCPCSKPAPNYKHSRATFSPFMGFECHNRCSCPPDCGNRLVQYGPSDSLGIISNEKGFGLVSKRGMERGEFVCEYAGEVIGASEAGQRRAKDDSNFIFTLVESGSGGIVETYVDATRIGNIGRYANHSCDPNCTVLPIRIDTLIPALAIFTNRNVASREELCYSYGRKRRESGGKRCLCAAENCFKILPCDFP